MNSGAASSRPVDAQGAAGQFHRHLGIGRTRPRRTSTATAAQAPLPQARVSPTPRSNTRRRIRSRRQHLGEADVGRLAGTSRCACSAGPMRATSARRRRRRPRSPRAGCPSTPRRSAALSPSTASAYASLLAVDAGQRDVGRREARHAHVDDEAALAVVSHRDARRPGCRWRTPRPRAQRHRAPARRRRSARRCRTGRDGRTIGVPDAVARRPLPALRGGSMVRIWSQPTPTWRSASRAHSAGVGRGQAAAQVQHDEVVAGAVHLGEAHGRLRAGGRACRRPALAGGSARGRWPGFSAGASIGRRSGGLLGQYQRALVAAGGQQAGQRARAGRGAWSSPQCTRAVRRHCRGSGRRHSQTDTSAITRDADRGHPPARREDRHRHRRHAHHPDREPLGLPRHRAVLLPVEDGAAELAGARPASRAAGRNRGWRRTPTAARTAPSASPAGTPDDAQRQAGPGQRGPQPTGHGLIAFAAAARTAGARSSCTDSCGKHRAWLGAPGRA